MSNGHRGTGKNQQQRLRKNQHQRRKLECLRLNDVKKANGCFDCALYDPMSPWRSLRVVLTFDHRDPEDKLFWPSSPQGHSITKHIAELDKCDVVCANHHAIRTRDREKACQST